MCLLESFRGLHRYTRSTEQMTRQGLDLVNNLPSPPLALPQRHSEVVAEAEVEVVEYPMVVAGVEAELEIMVIAMTLQNLLRGSMS